MEWRRCAPKMKQLVVISGKGGTGKTVIAAAFASLSINKVIADCDVDAANLYLLLHPDVQEVHTFSGGKKAFLLYDQCSLCGECVEPCRFEAISQAEDGRVFIDPVSCEGCGVCSFVCPSKAIEMRDSTSGEWYVSRTKYGPFVHAKLGIGEENSGKLVSEVRRKAAEIGTQNKVDYVIIDGPPGIGCPVIASLSGTNLALVVTEPTLSGIHDMERIVAVARHFQIPTACCINKYDINLENSSRIEAWCQDHSVPLLGKIPYDEEVIRSMVQGYPLTEHTESVASEEIHKLWIRLCKTEN
jgi:MinD superfamily P-loop ATPase